MCWCHTAAQSHWNKKIKPWTWAEKEHKITAMKMSARAGALCRKLTTIVRTSFLPGSSPVATLTLLHHSINASDKSCLREIPLGWCTLKVKEPATEHKCDTFSTCTTQKHQGIKQELPAWNLTGVVRNTVNEPATEHKHNTFNVDSCLIHKVDWHRHGDKGSHGTKLLLTEQLSSHNGCKCEPQNSFHHLAKPATTDRKPWGVSVMNKSAFITESRLVVGWHSQEATGWECDEQNSFHHRISPGKVGWHSQETMGWECDKQNSFHHRISPGKVGRHRQEAMGWECDEQNSFHHRISPGKVGWHRQEAMGWKCDEQNSFHHSISPGKVGWHRQEATVYKCDQQDSFRHEISPVKSQLAPAQRHSKPQLSSHSHLVKSAGTGAVTKDAMGRKCSCRNSSIISLLRRMSSARPLLLSSPPTFSSTDSHSSDSCVRRLRWPAKAKQVLWRQSAFSWLLIFNGFSLNSTQLCFSEVHLFTVTIIIMYIYHVLINAPSAHMIHINLNMIFYTHIEHRPSQTVYIKYYTEKQTHTHNDCSRNWVLILVGMKILREEECFQFGFKSKRAEQCLRSCGSEFQMWGPKQEKVRKPWILHLYCWIFSMRASEEEHSVRDGVQTWSSSER